MTFREQMRSFRLIFQAGGPAFLHFPAFFPVVGSVEVSNSFIDRLTNPPKRVNFKPSRYSEKTGQKWKNRFFEYGSAGLCD